MVAVSESGIQVVTQTDIFPDLVAGNFRVNINEQFPEPIFCLPS